MIINLIFPGLPPAHGAFRENPGAIFFFFCRRTPYSLESKVRKLHGAALRTLLGLKRQEREQAAGLTGFHLQCGQVTLEARERFVKEVSYPPITSKSQYSSTSSLPLEVRFSLSVCLSKPTPYRLPRLLSFSLFRELELGQGLPTWCWPTPLSLPAPSFSLPKLRFP